MSTIDTVRLKEIETQVLTEIQSITSAERFNPFILEEAARHGPILVSLYFETIGEFNRNSLGFMVGTLIAARQGRFANALWSGAIVFFRLITQTNPAFALPFPDSDGRLVRILIRPRMGIYPTALIPLSLGIEMFIYSNPHLYGLRHRPIIVLGVALVVYAVSSLFCRLTSMDAHEMCHAYQFILLERVRKALGLTVSWVTLKRRLPSWRDEIPLMPVFGHPPTLKRLESIVRSQFAALSRLKL